MLMTVMPLEGDSTYTCIRIVTNIYKLFWGTIVFLLNKHISKKQSLKSRCNAPTDLQTPPPLIPRFLDGLGFATIQVYNVCMHAVLSILHCA